MRWASRSPSIWLRTSLTGVLLVLAYYFFSPGENTRPQAAFRPTHPPDTDPCFGFPLTGNVVVSVKTGATEAAEKLPTLMKTTLRCAKDVFFFSDLEQDLGEYHLYDALNTVPAAIVDSNPDFTFYLKQYELFRGGRDMTSLKSAKTPESPGEHPAWTLDKYKNVHMVEKTWALKPDMDWYIFIDADTYVLWPNILVWLKTMDPTKKSYFGSEVSISGDRFAHGGSGIILSKASMQEIAVTHNGTAALWDPKIHEKCCGDLVLGLALKDYGIELQDAWPLMSGETQSTMPFGPGTPEYWCRPALTMHHLTPADMEELAAFEQHRLGNSEPLTHAELFRSLLIDMIPAHSEYWDNLASDPGEFGRTGGVSSDVDSFEECAKACDNDTACFQYSHHGRKCHLGMSVRRGYKKDPDGEGMWQSGWHKARLADWLSKQPSCNRVAFPKQG